MYIIHTHAHHLRAALMLSLRVEPPVVCLPCFALLLRGASVAHILSLVPASLALPTLPQHPSVVYALHGQGVPGPHPRALMQGVW